MFDALSRILKEEGLTTLWRGSVPTMARAAAMNIGMLVTYDEIKERVCKMMNRDPTDSSKKIRVLAGLGAGFMASACCLPFDNCKTKMQKQKKNKKTGKLPYKNIVDCAMKTANKEGVLKLWVGFPVFYSRVGTHAMTTLFTLDILHGWYDRNMSQYY